MVESLNRQRVLNFLEVFYSGDVEAALSRCSDDVEFFSNAPVDILPHMGRHSGKADMRAMWKMVHTRYYDMRHEVRASVAEDDKVAVDLRLFFKKSLNSRIVQFDLAAFYTLRDGRIAHIREIMDTYDLAAGAGARRRGASGRPQAGRAVSLLRPPANLRVVRNGAMQKCRLSLCGFALFEASNNCSTPGGTRYRLRPGQSVFGAFAAPHSQAGNQAT